MDSFRKPEPVDHRSFSARYTAHLPILDLTGSEKPRCQALQEAGIIDGEKYFAQLKSAVEEPEAQQPTQKKNKVDAILAASDAPMPPDCFRITAGGLPQPVPQAVASQTEFAFDDDFWNRGYLDWEGLQLLDTPSYNDQLSAAPPALPSIYCMAAYNYMTKNVRIFSADSKPDLLKNILIYCINEVNAETWRHAQAHLHKKVNTLPLFMQGTEYAIKCSAGGLLCSHTEVAPCAKDLIVQLFAHFVVTHCKNSEWYQNVSAGICTSPEEALKKLYGIT